MSLPYPESRTVEVTESLAGVSFPDPYRWLEEETEEVQLWQKAQGELAAGYVRQWPHFDALRESVARFTVERFGSAPRFAAGRWFRSHTPDGATQAQAVVADTPYGQGRVLFDPLVENPVRPPFLSWLSPSPDGRILAVGVCSDGSENNTIRLIDVGTGTQLPDAPPHVLMDGWTGGVQWLPGGSGFFFSAITGEPTEFTQQVYLHRLGTSPPTEMLSIPWTTERDYRAVFVSGDGRWAVAVERMMNPIPVAVAALDGNDLEWLPFVTTITGTVAGHVVDGRYVAITDVDAPRGRLVAIDLDNPEPNDPRTWHELVPASDAVLRTVTPVSDRLYVTEFIDTYAQVRILDQSGATVGVGAIRLASRCTSRPNGVNSASLLIRPPCFAQRQMQDKTSAAKETPVRAMLPPRTCQWYLRKLTWSNNCSERPHWMKIGMVVAPGNTADWDRFLASERHEDVPARPAVPDVQVWDEEISLGLEAESLGFDAIFCPEHHFTPYSFTTNPLQLLTYFAARTESIDVGSMVVVAPWHHPLRLAEEAVMLQHLMGTDRDLMLGLGRGLARREYNALGIDMGESRQRFAESVEILRLALAEPRFSYEGTHFTIPETAMRPYPRDLRLLDNLYCAWGSPQSAPIAAALGLKPFLIPQKPLDEYGDELALFAQVRAENGHAPAQPMLVTWVYCAETEEKARLGAEEHMRGYARTPVLHYEINSTHFSSKSGYEHYAAGAEAAARKNLDMVDGLTKIWLDNHIWGNPEQCFEKIRSLSAAYGPSHLVCSFKYGLMSLPEAQANTRLFAEEVLPAARALQAHRVRTVGTSA